jgi:Uma2 family endonuclease
MTLTREVDVMGSTALLHPIGSDTVEDWLAQDPPLDGSSLELIMGYFFVVPPPSGRHQSVNAELWAVLKSALRAAGRKDLYPVIAVGVQISTAWRTALIPDVAVLNVPSLDTTFLPEQLELVVEIWSPGNSHSEREVKRQAYAGAGVLFFWAVDFDRSGVPSITAHRLVDGDYEVAQIAKPGTTTTITASPVPVTLDPADLLP